MTTKQRADEYVKRMPPGETRDAAHAAFMAGAESYNKLSDEEKWAEVPGIFREQTMNAAAFHERYIRDLRECLYEKAIANASIHESDPKAWEKTVDKAFTWAFLLGDLVGGASTAGFPRAKEIRDSVAPSPDNPRHPPYDPRKEQAA
jgi:hypothetical protein